MRKLPISRYVNCIVFLKLYQETEIAVIILFQDCLRSSRVKKLRLILVWMISR